MSTKAFRFTFLALWVIFVSIICGVANWEFPADVFLTISYFTAGMMLIYGLVMTAKLMTKNSAKGYPSLNEQENN